MVSAWISEHPTHLWNRLRDEKITYIRLDFITRD